VRFACASKAGSAARGSLPVWLNGSADFELASGYWAPDPVRSVLSRRARLAYPRGRRGQSWRA
jgi:hypothetical protein